MRLNITRASPKVAITLIPRADIPSIVILFHKSSSQIQAALKR